jgi:quercetin dioxygenase-like cupin family protein
VGNRINSFKWTSACEAVLISVLAVFFDSRCGGLWDGGAGAPAFRHVLAEDNAMKNIDRRSTFALGLATATVALVAPQIAIAETYGPDYDANDGKESAPGIRVVEDISKRPSKLPAYETVSMRDFIYQPGAKMASPAMTNDMVCHCLTGELHIDHGEGPFAVKQGDVWSCAKDQPEASVNNGNTVAIMRVIDLIA